MISNILIKTSTVILSFLLNFSSSEERFTKRTHCDYPKAWFIYKGPAFRNAYLDPFVSLSQLRNPNNYFKTNLEVELLCDDEIYLCAICAEIDPNNTSRPLIQDQIGDDIYDHIGYYYSTGLVMSEDIIEKIDQN